MTPALYGVTDGPPLALPVPPGARTLDELYAGMDLGVYTVLRTFDGYRFLDLDAHLARIQRSILALEPGYWLDTVRLRRALDHVCRATAEPALRVRIDVLAGSGAHGGRELIGIVPLEVLPLELYEHGASARIVRGVNRDDPLIKRAAFVEQRKQFESDVSVHEHLIVDSKGRLLEGFISNFYVVMDNVLHTAGEGVLEGITRAIVLQQAAALGIELSLQAPLAGDRRRFHEAAISSSSRGYMPVTRIDGEPVGSGEPGPVSRRLLRAYASFVAAQVEPAVPGPAAAQPVERR